jgi:hypothetical protein
LELDGVAHICRDLVWIEGEFASGPEGDDVVCTGVCHRGTEDDERCERRLHGAGRVGSKRKKEDITEEVM